MSSSPEQLPALPIPGLPPDSLGNYLASLGLLRLLARTWPAVRVSWHVDILHVVGGPKDLGEVVDALVGIAAKDAWTPYERDWADAQKKSTKAKSGAPLALWQASAEESTLELITAHAVPAASVSFNPLLGSGGNAGRRDFSKGWKQATTELMRASSTQTKPRKTAKGSIADPKKELEALLLGQPATWLLEKLNAASWFSDANKLYNSGQAPFREGRLSPWAMVLACEGLPFLAGGASRRLGAHARAVGAFPFVTDAAAPLTSGEAGRDSGEFWAPVWDRPMTLPEVRALFSRGRAEVRGHGALTPSAFATAIVRRGVDAGITEFRRFVLGRTTSANTFEPRFEGTFRLSPSPAASCSSSRPEAAGAATSLQRVLDLVDRLPRAQKRGQRWRFVGLRGPIEKAMLQLASEPESPAAACGLLDAVVVALDRVDRNRSFRERRVSREPLPLEWLPALFGMSSPVVEARLALALVSGFPATYPLTLYRFGVETKSARFEHPASPPKRWVWGPGPLAHILSKVLLRRTLDWESARDKGSPARQGLPTTFADVSRWLDGSVDETALARWISRLSLFDWNFIPTHVRAALAPPRNETVPVNGPLALFGLFSPLFDVRPLFWRDGPVVRDLLDPESGARTPGAARALASLVQVRQIEPAVRLAGSRYSMANAPLGRTSVPWEIHSPDRLLASILFSIPDHERTALIERWLQPQRRKGEPCYA